jgi:hypothetical protein
MLTRLRFHAGDRCATGQRDNHRGRHRTSHDRSIRFRVILPRVGVTLSKTATSRNGAAAGLG